MVVDLFVQAEDDDVAPGKRKAKRVKQSPAPVVPGPQNVPGGMASVQLQRAEELEEREPCAQGCGGRGLLGQEPGLLHGGHVVRDAARGHVVGDAAREALQRQQALCMRSRERSTRGPRGHGPWGTGSKGAGCRGERGEVDWRSVGQGHQGIRGK